MGLRNDLNALFNQFVKFGIVGLSNVFVQLTMYYLLLYADVHYIIAYIISFITSVLNAYFWNNRYVFKNSDSTFWNKFIKVYISYFITFLLTTVLLYLCVEVLELSKIIAPIIILFITTPINFVLNKSWAFKK